MKTNRSQLKKIATIPCLYRHAGNSSYYGIKKQGGKIVTKAFKTAQGAPITSLQEAKVALSEWLVSLAATAAPKFWKSPVPAMNSMVRLLKESAKADGFDLAANSPAFAILSQDANGPEDEWRIQRQFLETQKRAKEIERDSMEIAKAEVLGETQEYEQSRKEKLAANSTPTLGQCFDDFLIYKNGVKEGTIVKYKYVKRTFELYGGKPLLKTPVANITPQVMAEFLIKLGGKPQYFNTVSIVINQVFEMLRIKKIIKENPFHLLPRNITHRRRVEPRIGCIGRRLGQRGGDLKTLLAGRAITLGHFHHQHRLF